MAVKHFRFEFAETTDMAEVENSLLMAVIAAEGIHGRSRVNLEGGFTTNHQARTSIVNADTEVGNNIAKVFTEFLNLEVGEGSFKVVRNREDIDHSGDPLRPERQTDGSVEP